MNKLLIVDDEPFLLEALEQILSRVFKDQLIIIKANNGQEAWSLINSDPEISIVLSDVLMPIKDGTWLLQQIIDNKKDLKIFYMTGQALETDLSYINKYAIKIFYKPFSVTKDILPEIKKTLSNV